MNVELEVHQHAESRNGKNIAVSLDGVAKNAQWLPLSQVEIIERGTGPKHAEMTIAIPEWLAMDRGLV